MKNKVVVVGSYNTDMTIKTKKLPNPGETVIGGSFSTGGGGKGANQAIAAARVGVSGWTSEGVACQSWGSSGSWSWHNAS